MGNEAIIDVTDDAVGIRTVLLVAATSIIIVTFIALASIATPASATAWLVLAVIVAIITTRVVFVLVRLLVAHFRELLAYWVFPDLHLSVNILDTLFLTISTHELQHHFKREFLFVFELSGKLQKCALVIFIFASHLLEVDGELVLWWGYHLHGSWWRGREGLHRRVETGRE